MGIASVAVSTGEISVSADTVVFAVGAVWT